MILRLTVAALTALAAAPASAAADPWQAACAALDRLAPPDRPPATARLRPAAAAELARRGAAIGFSGSVLVATHGRVRLARGYGAADAGGARAMTPDTVIDIGSVSKQFTAAAVMHLAEQGRLAPSDRIGRFLPDVPPDKNGITIHQLLTHGAGLPADADSVRTAATRADAVAAALAVPLAAAPGARHLYSNIGYVLLAAIVEAAAGQSYEEVLAPLWRKAGLRSTGWALARRPGLAAADGRNLAGIVATPDPATWRGDGPNWGRRGPGALLSTSRDLARWIAALRAGRVLSDASLRAMLAPHIREPGAAPSFYGYGWTVSRTPGGRCRIWHDGSNSRHFNALSVYPESDSVTHVASLDARSPVSAATLGAFEAVLFGTTAVALPDRQETRRRDVARLAGRFVDPEGAVLDLRAAGNRILVRATAPDAARLLGGIRAARDRRGDADRDPPESAARDPGGHRPDRSCAIVAAAADGCERGGGDRLLARAGRAVAHGLWPVRRERSHRDQRIGRAGAEHGAAPFRAAEHSASRRISAGGRARDRHQHRGRPGRRPVAA